MAEEDENATELHKAEVVLRVSLPAGDEATEVLEPSKESLDLPPPSIAPHGATVLRDVDPIRAMRGNHLDIPLGGQSRIQGITVVRRIADQPLRIALRYGGVERLLDERDFMR